MAARSVRAASELPRRGVLALPSVAPSFQKIKAGFLLEEMLDVRLED